MYKNDNDGLEMVEKGEYTFTIGYGNYTFRAWNNDKSMYGEITKIFPEEILWNEATIEIS